MSAQTIIALPRDIVGLIQQNTEFNSVTIIYMDSDSYEQCKNTKNNNVTNTTFKNRKDMFEYLIDKIINIKIIDNKVLISEYDGCDYVYNFECDIEKYKQYDIYEKILISLYFVQKVTNTVQISKNSITISDIHHDRRECHANIITCYSSNEFNINFDLISSFVDKHTTKNLI